MNTKMIITFKLEFEFDIQCTRPNEKCTANVIHNLVGVGVWHRIIVMLNILFNSHKHSNMTSVHIHHNSSNNAFNGLHSNQLLHNKTVNSNNYLYIRFIKT